MKRKLLWMLGGAAGVAVASVVFVVAAVGFAWHASAADPVRPKWDQEEAVRRVKAITAKEAAGEFDWDKVAWMTDPAKAVELARKEQKPIFLYFFLKGDIGPAAAPC